MRGQSLEGRCPECQRPVRASMDPSDATGATVDRMRESALASTFLAVGAIAAGPLMAAAGTLAMRATGAFDTIPALQPLRAAGSVIRGPVAPGETTLPPSTGWAPLLADAAMLAWIVGFLGVLCLAHGLAALAAPAAGDDGPGDATLQRRGVVAFSAIAGLLLVVVLPGLLREPLLEPAGLVAIVACVAAWSAAVRRVGELARTTEPTPVAIAIERHRRTITWLIWAAVWLSVVRFALAPLTGIELVAGARRALALEAVLAIAVAGLVLSWSGFVQLRTTARALLVVHRRSQDRFA